MSPTNEVALITGINGQDGPYLAEFLLNKAYEVHEIKRRSPLFNINRIDHLYRDAHETGRTFILHHGDLTDSSSMIDIIPQVQPAETHDLVAQRNVEVKFETSGYRG
jgi:GDPmannose 4,6-dehydratase